VRNRWQESLPDPQPVNLAARSRPGYLTLPSSTGLIDSEVQLWLARKGNGRQPRTGFPYTGSELAPAVG